MNNSKAIFEKLKKKRLFWNLKWSKITATQVKNWPNFEGYLNLRGHSACFTAENTTKVGLFRPKAMSKYFKPQQNIFYKGKKTTLDHQNCQNTTVTSPKNFDSCFVHFRSSIFNIDFLATKKKLSFPLIAKVILKKDTYKFLEVKDAQYQTLRQPPQR